MNKKIKLLFIIIPVGYACFVMLIFAFNIFLAFNTDKLPAIVWAKKRNSEYYSNDDNYVKLSGVVIDVGERFDVGPEHGMDVYIQCDEIKNYYPKDFERRYNMSFNDLIYIIFCYDNIDLNPGDEIEFVVAKYNKRVNRGISPLIIEVVKDGNILLDRSEGKELLLQYVTNIHYK